MDKFEKYMNKHECEEYVTIKYRDKLQDMIKPEYFIYALLMAEEYQSEGFTLSGFIAELKKAIAKTIPDRNIEISNTIDKNLSNIKMYTDIVVDIVGKER